MLESGRQKYSEQNDRPPNKRAGLQTASIDIVMFVILTAADKHAI